MKNLREQKLIQKALDFDSSDESSVDGEIEKLKNIKITPLSFKKNQEKSLIAEKSKMIIKPRSKLNKLAKKLNQKST
jgi:hypothetical protein